MKKSKKEIDDEIKEETTEEVEEKDLEQNSSDEVEEKLNSEIEELKNQLLRLQADFVNYKNRTEREKSNSIILANEGLILKLLPVLDNFNRAFTHVNVEDETVKGFVMIKEQFESILKTEMVEEIESDGAVFDPNLHNAVMTESKDGVDSGIVLETFEKGYKIKDKVIRPSMVKVSE
ncbi:MULTISPECIES: nucleotide exchange factor GrpE [unclassified Parvimonas]|uniref:nucleotide exchange factor GrpE n=1 Tax=unclassified Parvimonas TaxID=1151464 RepID=UPI002B4A4D3A|nr:MULTISPECIES: nucleotide exchange factor GrpE [unclassified Parvimonas]MEB3024229.1 nucleotide exchange factor GrpE [Parvimonas sp. M13]MEB3073408.1 nucleotide exchange factor GrpE [Parvimonas sp. C2]MEB3088375.1 nucleotide exchange factor GrpE [Parvimonas sp. M20]